jgi:hypothetical protein
MVTFQATRHPRAPYQFLPPATPGTAINGAAASGAQAIVIRLFRHIDGDGIPAGATFAGFFCGVRIHSFRIPLDNDRKFTFRFRDLTIEMRRKFFCGPVVRMTLVAGPLENTQPLAEGAAAQMVAHIPELVIDKSMTY